MQKRNKIILIVFGVLFLGGFVFAYSNSELFQGRMFSYSDPLPAYDENKCHESDGGKNYEEAGTTYGKLSRSKFGNEVDVCITRTKVKEYYCDGKFIQSEEYNCKNGCSKGACKGISSEVPKFLATAANKYFLDNAGELDCDKDVNEDFCDLYDNADKYTGFGNHELKFGDMVEIKPFIFHWKSEGWYGNMQAIWIDSSGEALLIEQFGFSPFGSLNFSAQDFEGVYMMTDLSKVIENDTVTFQFVDNPDAAIQWCKNQGIDICGGNFSVQLDDEIETEKEDLIVFTTKGFDDYNKHEAKSFQVCYDTVKNYLQIEPLLKPIIVRTIISDQSGGCSAGGNMLVCNSTPSYAEFILDFENGEYLGPELKAGNCVKAVAAHELTHVFIEGTPLEQRMWTEGLATYLELTDVFDAPSFECLENGYKLGFSEEPYHDLGSGEFTANTNHYTTAACVWDHIVVNYSYDKFLDVLEKADKFRYKAGSYKIAEDVLVPVLGPKILSELADKFNYVDFVYERTF